MFHVYSFCCNASNTSTGSDFFKNKKFFSFFKNYYYLNVIWWLYCSLFCIRFCLTPYVFLIIIPCGDDNMFNIDRLLLFKILLSILIIIFAKIIGPLIAYIIIKMFNLKETNKDNIKKNAFYKPIKTLVLFIGLYSITFIFYIPENIKIVLIKVFRICIVLVLANGFSNLFDTNSKTFLRFKEKVNFRGNDSLINFSSKIIKILIYIFTGFIIVSELGYNLGGLVTGLGISSVVIALAAQDFAKSLFGGLSIVLDKPFNVGDYIWVNNFEGTVEEISFRSTRIRNLSKELIVVRNSQIAESYIINYNKRNTRLYKINLVLELDTPLEKISTLKEKILVLLNSEEHVIKENIRVFFSTISDNGYDINIAFHTDIFNYTEFLQFKENMNFKIMHLLQDEQIELAYDSKTIYLKK